ncbi:MAG: TlpA disulfide reductase family protein [Proteiniphilum sp.]
MMKKNAFLYLCCLLVISSCTNVNNQSFTLKGKIGDWNDPATIYLSYWNEGSEYKDSTILRNGSFSFTGSVGEPAPARLIFDYSGEGMIPAAQSGHILYLYLENGTVKLNSPDSLQNSLFVDSPINDEHLSYLDYIDGQIQDLAARMNQKVMLATPEQLNDTTFMAQLNSEYKQLLDERTRKQQQYVREHPDSYFSVVAISESVSSKFNVDEIEPLFLSINEKYRETYSGKAFAQRIEAARTIGIGKKAPDFTQNDPDGNPVSLSDFSGKYLLLDFWASWCGPCRQENPNLVKAYAAYKDKGFEILGVSLDNQDGKEAWLNAIKKDGLTWTQVSDLNSWNNEVARSYGVRAVPQSYLIDPQGIIVAQDLRGEALDEKLVEIFGE